MKKSTQNVIMLFTQYNHRIPSETAPARLPRSTPPIRKQHRLSDYDYSQNGAYFITICTFNRKKILGDVGASCVRPLLSDMGSLVEKKIVALNSVYECVRVDKHIVMPNHIHMILLIDCASGRIQFAPTIPRVIKQFKGSITKQVGYPVWQKSYHDHVIRGDNDYRSIWQYIETNPQKWLLDCYYE